MRPSFRSVRPIVALLTLMPAHGGEHLEGADPLAAQSEIVFFDCLPGMRDERARPLMAKFDELLRHHATFREIFGRI